MIALDTNLLVYAHREDSSWHEPARDCVEELAGSPGRWAIPWPCVHEFLAVVTHPRIFDPPTPLAKVLDQIEAWTEAPNLVLLSETRGYWERLRATVEQGRVSGPLVHDARVAAICQAHGISELWSADRDFGRFPDLIVRNPLLDRTEGSR